MRLYLVRHGEALPKAIDISRPLSERGRREAQKVAEFLKPLGLRVREIWHSGKTRAAQTAEIIASAIVSDRGLKAVEGMAPDDAVSPFLVRIVEADGDVLLVGHLPFLDKMAGALIVGKESVEIFTLPTGGVACMERNAEGAWRLVWMLDPDIIPDEVIATLNH